MEPEINHDLDIDGDVLLVLQNPNEPFAVWNEEEDWELSRPKRRGTTSLEESFTIKLYRVVDPACESYHRSLVDPAPESAERDEPRRKKLKSSPSSVTSGSPEVRFRLSSRHLILASPYFRAMLTGPWAENSSRAGSMYIASASDWDDGALTILMDIIHGHSERIPSSMSLELLAKIAVLVDYYKCHKIVKSYSDTWIEGTLGRGETNLPQRYSRDLILCLFIACVFAQHKITEDLTRILVRKSRGPVRTLGLPFPDGLLERIDDSRMAIVEEIIGYYDDLMGHLGTRDCCKEYQCSSVLLGRLMREMMAQGIFNPRPARPLLGFSVEEAIQMTLAIERPNWERLGSSSSHVCSLRNFFVVVMVPLHEKLKGLVLDDRQSDSDEVNSVASDAAFDDDNVHY